jgi:hypothetical protein
LLVGEFVSMSHPFSLGYNCKHALVYRVPIVAKDAPVVHSTLV